ncbi:restriction endonuclease [Candidatus Methylospira mobilis]|uniref:Restriction endonuclease n=1 Tax=Candidatus Methylospira mobilis TaxID=1808979 RepID=A0A5Q0BR30_9GAMM|nr:restriction endonuclease [Candidatus Methylospira mobilis]QFY44538.1 restriction endonuclease [Candidatus Methylospira mobilis]WNV06031.1 restriction endonuclease [Candidatus Methylospira mobilis]
MAIWLIRAGSHGEYEQKFIQDNRVYLTWDNLDQDLARLTERAALTALMVSLYPDAKPKTVQNWVSQIWPFAHEIKKGDLVVLPSKSQPVIYFGEISGDYTSEPAGVNPFYHWRPVKWMAEPAQRASFSQDLLYSFGAFMTICRIQRNNAEQRIIAMRANGWNPETGVAASKVASAAQATDETAEEADLEELARDQIAQLIAAKFKGHNLTRLVEAVLQAQGYTTYRSPEGADGGADILAGSGPLGFEAPRLCIEVKSETTQIGREAVDKLLGAMTKFNADQGLFVAWGGFKGNVHKELASQFFRLRLWTQKELLEQLFEQYEKLDDELKAELPLKRVWMVAAAQETV